MAVRSCGYSAFVTFIGTATSIIEVNGLRLLTDPFFSPSGSTWDRGYAVLKVDQEPGLQLDQLPYIDAILLSHDDHPDNLDQLGRQLLDGRRVFTTEAAARNLAPRPGVVGMAAWNKVPLFVGQQQLELIATPCIHAPTGEVTGFIITGPGFGSTSGLPNAIWFSGDTIYMDELRDIGKKFHVNVALLNMGAAQPGNLKITMSAHEAAKLFLEIDADVLIPMHFDGWDHFKEGPEALKQAIAEFGIQDKVCWLKPGEKREICSA